MYRSLMANLKNDVENLVNHVWTLLVYSSGADVFLRPRVTTLILGITDIVFVNVKLKNNSKQNATQ